MSKDGKAGMPYSILEIFRTEDGKHFLTLFPRNDIDWLESQLFDKNGTPYVKCLASDKDRPAKPEEIMRQLWIKKLLDEYR
jgi:type I restriction enzyme M protein